MYVHIILHYVYTCICTCGVWVCVYTERKRYSSSRIFIPILPIFIPPEISESTHFLLPSCFLKLSQFMVKWYRIVVIWVSLISKNLKIYAFILPILLVDVLFLCSLLIWGHSESLFSLDYFYDFSISQCPPSLGINISYSVFGHL